MIELYLPAPPPNRGGAVRYKDKGRTEIMFTLAEKNLMVIYNTGSRLGLMNELGNMLSYLSDDETELHDITVSVIEKLNRITDAEFDALDLMPDTFEKDW